MSALKVYTFARRIIRDQHQHVAVLHDHPRQWARGYDQGYIRLIRTNGRALWFIKPGKPVQIAFVESFNARLRSPQRKAIINFIDVPQATAPYNAKEYNHIALGGRSMTDFPDGWLMSKRDYEILDELRDEVWSWRRGERDPLTMLAISAMVYEMDQIMAREEAGNVLTLSFENYNFIDGRRAGSEASISISDEGISLQRMEVEFGDHQSETLAFLSPDGDFNEDAVRAWLRAKDEVSGALTANIDALTIGV